MKEINNSLNTNINNNLNTKTLKSKKIKTIGPVINLEEHVHAEWWRQIFNSFYLKTDGDVVNDNEITQDEINLFCNILNFNKEDFILDLCCGHGRHSLELARKGFNNIYGLDSSHYLIQKAKTQAKKDGLNIIFKEGGARKLPFKNDTFNYVLVLGNSFGYFETVEDDLRVLKEIYRVLKPRGKLLIDVSDGEYLKKEFSPRSWEWIDKNYFVCRERSLSIDNQRLITREVITHVEKGVIADQFYAERLYNENILKNLLETVGFKKISLHANISTSSKRNQDLGMMEKRLIISSEVIKEWSETKIRPKKNDQIKNVTVLMGDPKINDIIKPNSIFDDDDFFTIDQLKNALHSINNYNFSYLSNHKTLINDLTKNKSNIDYVLNLCDEGFYNEAKKELHIPSLLEILNIKYTGAGPQCLAFCYDKSLVRGIAKEMDIPVPDAFFIKAEDNTFDLSINFPVIVKPNFGDSSFGITKNSVTNNVEELINAITEIREKLGYDKPIIVEEFLEGKDLSIGIIGNPPESYNFLPIIEEDYSRLPEGLPKICGYEAKWLPNSEYWTSLRSIPAVLPEKIEQIIIECSIKLFERLECRDYSRFDWRLDKKGNPKLLEVNPNPGWCWDGHMAKMSKIANISYKEMLENILKTAELRMGIYGNKNMEIINK